MMAIKEKRGFWKPATIALCVLLGIGAAGGAGYWFASKPDAPKQSLTTTTATAAPTAPENAQSPAAPEMPAHPIRGNRKSKIYHWYGCGSYDRIADKNIVEFATREEAEAAGYRAARNC